MKFNCNWLKDYIESKEFKAYGESCKWKKKFAWLPVKISSNLCVWLECYEERFDSSFENFKYDNAYYWYSRRVLDDKLRTNTKGS